MSQQLKENRKDLKAMIVMFKAYQSLIEVIKNDIKDTGFDFNEFTVLEVVYHKKCITVAEIKDKVLVANSSLTYILDKLENKSLIVRKRSEEDKRIIYVELTKEGMLESNKIFPKHYEVLKEIYSVLTEDDKTFIADKLKTLGLYAKKYGGNK